MFTVRAAAASADTSAMVTAAVVLGVGLRHATLLERIVAQAAPFLPALILASLLAALAALYAVRRRLAR